MTAPANITPAAVERYGPTLDALCPGFDGVQRRQRCGILYLRDRATAGLRVAGWEASMVLRTIESLACVHVFATLPAGELEELHHALVSLMVVAMDHDMLRPGGGGQVGNPPIRLGRLRTARTV